MALPVATTCGVLLAVYLLDMTTGEERTEGQGRRLYVHNRSCKIGTPAR